MSYKECEHCFGTGLDHGGCEHDLRIEKLETALKQIQDCDWPGPHPLEPSRADWMQQIAREALKL
jgi:hypothetical protein